MGTRKAKITDTLDESNDLLSLPGIDPERVRTLMTRLHVKNRADLKQALATGKLVGLRGFSRGLKVRLLAALMAEPDRS